MAAFELSVRQGADGIELDVKLSADGHVVVIHDNTVNRTTDGSGDVSNLSLQALKDLDAGSFFAPSFRGEKIPALSEVLEAVGNKILINIELTNYKNPFDPLPEKVIDLVVYHQLTDRVLFSSFNPLSLFRIKQLLPNSPVGLLTLGGRKGTITRILLDPFLQNFSLHPFKDSISPTLVQKAHQTGKRVYPYTVNHQDEIRQLIEIGVDGIFTDDPLLGRQVINTVFGNNS